MKYYVVYWAYSLKLKLNYIGFKSFINWCEFTNYNTSSRYFGFKESIPNKYIIKWFNNKKDALNYEIKLHNRFNVGNNKKFANKCKSISNGFCTEGIKLSKNHRKKLSLAKLGNDWSRKKKKKKGQKKSIKYYEYYQYDHTKYLWYNFHLKIYKKCTSYKLIKKYNLNKAHISQVKNGKRIHHKGWKCLCLLQ